MTAVGFGQRVTGGDAAKDVLTVTNQPEETLADALAEAMSRSKQGKPTRIVIGGNVVVPAASSNKVVLEVKANDLTIEGLRGSKIMANQLEFDCSQSDNVILRNLTFEGASTNKKLPRDAIKIDATKGRGPKGFWLDHCHFEAYFDLNMTANANDQKGAPPLLITVSSCYFHNDNPNGIEHDDNGAFGIHGAPGNKNTNAYATVYGNVFETVRRRSPRSSGLSYVHAFNNVLLKWGATDKKDDQINGMASGHLGRLVAEANYFLAGPVKEAIQVSDTKGRPGALTVHEDDDVLKNVYLNGAKKAKSAGDPIDINAAYANLNLTVPKVKKMDDALMKKLRADAGPKFT